MKLKVIIVAEEKLLLEVLKPLKEEEIRNGLIEGWIDRPSKIRSIFRNIAEQDDSAIDTAIQICWKG